MAKRPTEQPAASDKEQLLEAYAEARQSENNLQIKNLLIALGILLIALMLFIPKIYLRNHIYFASRDIEQLQIQKNLLEEENKQLQKQLEDIKFKNLVMDMAY